MKWRPNQVVHHSVCAWWVYYSNWGQKLFRGVTSEDWKVYMYLFISVCVAVHVVQVHARQRNTGRVWFPLLRRKAPGEAVNKRFSVSPRWKVPLLIKRARRPRKSAGERENWVGGATVAFRQADSWVMPVLILQKATPPTSKNQVRQEFQDADKCGKQYRLLLGVHNFRAVKLNDVFPKMDTSNLHIIKK